MHSWNGHIKTNLHKQKLWFSMKQWSISKLLRKQMGKNIQDQDQVKSVEDSLFKKNWNIP